MKIARKSVWLELDKPLGEPDVFYNDKTYRIERFETDEQVVWFGINTNLKKQLPDGNWKQLVFNEDAEVVEKYLPEMVYSNATKWIDVEEPIYEKLYKELEK